MKTKITPFQSALLWAAGYDRNTAEQCTTSEIRKMSIAGTMVLIPAMLALVSYGYAFYVMSKGSLQAAIAGGAAAALIIFLIDRSIMAFGRPGNFSLGMLGRVLLAVTISFILAEPVALWMFRDSIAERQVNELEDARMKAVAPFEKRITLTRTEIEPYEARLQELQRQYTAEMDGTGGSGVINQGQIYRKKHNDYLAYRKERNAKLTEINSRVEAIEAEKAQRLLAVQQTHANGLLGQVRTLHRLGQDEPIVAWATWLLRMALVLIELLPLLLKISPSGDRGLYYSLVDMLDQEREEVMKGQSDARAKVLVKENDLRCQEEYYKLCVAEVDMLMSQKSHDSVHLMDRVLAMSEKRAIYKQRAAKRFADDAPLLNTVFAEIDSIFESFVRTVQSMNQRSDDNFSTNNA